MTGGAAGRGHPGVDDGGLRASVYLTEPRHVRLSGASCSPSRPPARTGRCDGRCARRSPAGACEWPLVGIGLSTVELDGAALAAAADGVVALWPAP